jgi:hypothetical protein
MYDMPLAISDFQLAFFHCTAAICNQESMILEAELELEGQPWLHRKGLLWYLVDGV